MINAETPQILLSYAPPGVGLYEFRKNAEDVGKFKAPTLRNIALTAFHMHGGSIPIVDGVFDYYAASGRAHDNLNKDSLIDGFPHSEQDRRDLIKFLKCLTGEPLLHNLEFANPWPQSKGTQP